MRASADALGARRVEKLALERSPPGRAGAHRDLVGCQPGMSRTILPSLPPAAKRCVRGLHLRQRERLFDGNPQASSGDVRQDMALDEAGGDGFGLERASPQRGAVDAPAQTHELAEVDLTAPACADADDRDAASCGKRVHVGLRGSAPRSSSKMTSYGPCAAVSAGSTAVAPSSATARLSSGLRTLAMTEAPASRCAS